MNENPVALGGHSTAAKALYDDVSNLCLGNGMRLVAIFLQIK